MYFMDTVAGNIHKTDNLGAAPSIWFIYYSNVIMS